MDRSTFAVLVSGLFLSMNSPILANESNLPKVITSPIQKVYIPTGFDDNDNVEVVLKGTFPNSCYRIGQSKATVNKETKQIEIEADSYLYQGDGSFCMEVISEFLQPVKLGLLEKGDYTVTVKEQKADLKKPLEVKQRSSEAPDDYLYASVENAYINFDFETGKQSLVLQGHFPYWFHGCQVITEVKTYRDPEDILVVLPITEIVQGDVCDQQPRDREFTKVVGLDSPFTEEGMIHVRTFNGQSINRLVPVVY